MSTAQTSRQIKRITICPSCAHRMRVKLKHIGRACRCTRCREPVFITQEDVIPPFKLFERGGARYFDVEDVPLHWQKGDRFLGRYEVVDFLGAGGMGVVHLVHHKSWGVDLAVKTPSSKLLGRENMLKQFEKEAEVWVGLPHHPNIVYCYYVMQMGSMPRIFMEYVAGESLGDCIRERRLYQNGSEEALRKVITIALQVAYALDVAHAHGLVHQDVKPTNILVTPDWNAKVTDFGLVRALSSEEDSGDESSSNYVPGTPPYSSPEQASFGPITRKADMWGWAASVIEMLVGGVSWRNHRDLLSALDIYLSTKEESSDLPLVPDSLARLLRDCFCEDPSGRPADMRDISSRLTGIYEEIFAEPCDVQPGESSEATPASLNNRAVSLADLGKGSLAEELWHQALQKHPRHFESRYNFGLHQWRQGRVTDSQLLHMLVRACEDDTTDWLPKQLLGRVLIERGDYAATKDVLDTIPEPDYSRREVFIAAAVARRDAARGHFSILSTQAHAAPIVSIYVSDDGSCAVSGDALGAFKVWNIGDNCTCEASFESWPANALCITRDNRCIILARDDGNVELRDIAENKRIGSFTAHQGAVLAVCCDPDQSRVATGGEDHQIRIWKLDDGEQIGALEGHKRGVNALDWSPCGRFVLSGSTDTRVRLWDFALAETVLKMHGHARRVFGVAFGSDDKTAYSSGRDGLLNEWDLASGLLRNSYQAHTTEAYSLSASPDSDYLLTGSRNGAVRLWDMSKGYCVRSFTGSAPCRISRNGKVAVSGDDDGVLRVWRISPERSRYPATHVFCQE